MRFLILFFLSFNAIAGIGGNQIIKQADFIEGLKSDKNFVKNASFEDTTYDSSWTITSGTQSLISSTPFGSNAIRFTGSVANGNIQSLTGSGTAQAGLNCLVSAFVKTASNNVQLCAIHNGTLNTNLCVNVNSNNAWAQYQIPTVCDAVSTVARIRITTSVATTFDADNVYVGVNPNITSISANTSWESFTPTFTNLGTPTNVSCLKRREETDLLISCRFTSATGSAAAASMTLPDSLTTSSSLPSCVSSGCSVVGNMYRSSALSGALSVLVQPSTSAINFGISSGTGGSILANGDALWSSGAQVGFYARVPIEQYKSTATVISTNNQNYPPTAFTPSFPQGFVTVSNESCFKSRRGKFLILDCKFTTSGNPVEARVSLPDSLTIDSSITPSIRPCGSAWRNGGSIPYATLCTGGLSYLTFALTTDYFTATTASNLVSAGQTFGFKAEIPIQGWNNDNVIVGTFAGVGNIKGLNNSVNEVMFGFGTTTQYTRCTASPCTIFENGSAFNISVTRSTTGLYQIVFPSDFSPTVKPKCWLTGKESSVSRAGYCGYQSTNPTSTTINLECRDGTGNIADVYMDVFCKGY